MIIRPGIFSFANRAISRDSVSLCSSTGIPALSNCLQERYLNSCEMLDCSYLVPQRHTAHFGQFRYVKCQRASRNKSVITDVSRRGAPRVNETIPQVESLGDRGSKNDGDVPVVQDFEHRTDQTAVFGGEKSFAFVTEQSPVSFDCTSNSTYMIKLEESSLYYVERITVGDLHAFK